MSLKLPSNPKGGLFKQGYTSQTAADGALTRNTAACRQLSQLVASSIGPCGRNKIIVNDLGKISITSDAAKIVQELNVVHPAAKVLAMYAAQQKEEMGDGTNYVLVLAGEMLHLSEKLAVMGLTPAEIVQGFKMGCKYALAQLDELVASEIEDIKTAAELLKIVKPVVSSKMLGMENLISNLVVEAVTQVIPPNSPNKFNTDGVRVVKILGGSHQQSFVLKGMVLPREPESQVKKLNAKSKVVVFNCPVDISASETKTTVLLHNAEEMKSFSKGEEDELHQVIKAIADSGVKVVIAGQNVGQLALHFLDQYGLLVLKVPSKFDLRRICRVCGATPLVRLGAPLEEEMGSIDVVETREIGSDRVTVFQQNDQDISLTSTIVVRGATLNSMDDIERAIDAGVSSVKAVIKNPKLLPGAGSTECELIKRLTVYGERTPGLLQLPIKKFAEAFEFLPRLLCETSGLDPNEVLPRLYASHEDANPDSFRYGIDIQSEDFEECLMDIQDEGIYDSLLVKKNAIQLATEAVCTVLAVDQIIVAKRAGGPVMPKGPKPGNWDQDD